MTDEELQMLLLGGESDRVERKASPADGDKIRQAICAFANDLPKSDRPGVVFVGVNDDGTCANLPIDDRLLQTLGGMRSDGNITPFPVMTVQKRSVAGCEIAVIIVSPSDSPPVRFKGRVWIRTGPRRDIAGPEEERRLGEKRRSRDLPFDIRPLDGLSLQDLDVDLFSQAYLPNAIAPDVLEQNRRTIEDQLRSLRFLNFEGVPTVLGNLVIGRDPLRALPGAYVQFLRLSGGELTDPIKDRKEIGGPLTEVIGQLDKVVLAHISTALDVAETGSEIKHPDYPIAAIQQIARNAILHRTYDGNQRSHQGDLV